MFFSFTRFNFFSFVTIRPPCLSGPLGRPGPPQLDPKACQIEFASPSRLAAAWTWQKLRACHFLNALTFLGAIPGLPFWWAVSFSILLRGCVSVFLGGKRFRASRSLHTLPGLPFLSEIPSPLFLYVLQGFLCFHVHFLQCSSWWACF